MDSSMKYCRSCGKSIPRTAKFCRYCGFQFSAPDNSAPDAQRDTSAQKPPAREKHKTPGKAKKNTGLRAVAVVLAAALLFTGFVSPGFFRKKTGDGGSAVTKIEYKKTSEKDVLSAEKLSAELPDSGVKIRLTPYMMDEGQQEKLVVESINPVYAENGDYVIKPYRVDLGDIHTLADFAEIRIPYDTTFCDPGEDPAECVGGVYLNPETGEWEETLYTVDAEAGEIVIETDHFSEFGAMTVKNKGRRDAILSGGSSFGDGDIGYLTDSQAISTMQVMCQNYSADTPTARLAGNQVMQAAMALGGATAELSDTAGTVFSIAYFLDITDVAMTGNYFNYFGDTNYLDYVPGAYADTSVTYTNRSFNMYNNDLIKKSGEVLSNVGTVVSACKVGYLAGKAAAGEAEDSEVLQLYKECAGMTVSLSGSATLSALMGPVMLADTFINYMFTESTAIKESQIQEMYVWFNEKYPGTGAPYYTRPGRSAADWRKVIIKLIDDNPGADTAELLEDEVNEFCNEFWDLSSDEIADVVAQCPKNIKRVTDTDRAMRSRITEAYKKQLFNMLNMSVMPSVREYYNKQMFREAQKSISRAKAYYNQEISFDVFEPEHTDKHGNSGDRADNVYGGYKCCFMPLSQDAEPENWSSTIPEKNVGLHGTFTLIGHITAGSPGYMAVFEPDADIRTAKPVLTVPVSIGGKVDGKYNARIILEKEKQADISDFCGTWYDEHGYEIQIDTFADGQIGIYNFAWTEDWLLSDYVLMPQGSAVTVYGEEYSLEANDSMIRLLNPKASTYALSTEKEHYAVVDGTGTKLALFISGSVSSYTREKPVKEEMTIQTGGTVTQPPPGWDGVSGYDTNWQLIPEGDND